MKTNVNITRFLTRSKNSVILKMSEILGRTWSYLTSSGSGPKWSVPCNQSSSTAHLPHGLAQFMKAVLEAPTSVSEAELVKTQLNAIQMKLQEPNIKTSVLSDCIVRAMLCSILGYSVNFVSINALQLAQKGSITEKKLGYMACVMFLQEKDDLILLLINTIMRDLQSKNEAENNMALIAASYLVPREMTAMLIPIVIEKTKHSRCFIRKKALVCLEQISIKAPESVDQVCNVLVQCLSDADPGVVFTAIQAVTCILTNNSHLQVSIIDSICQVQKQILNKKLPAEYNVHNIPAPWGQMQIMLLIQILNNQKKIPNAMESEIIFLLTETLEQPFPEDRSMGQAVIFECIKTLIGILPTSSQVSVDKRSKIVKRILRYLSNMIKYEHNNYKYIAIVALELLILHQEDVVSPQLSEVEQEFVFSCLKNDDESIKRKSYGLLHALATANNAKDICEKMLVHLKDITDDFYKRDIIIRIINITEKFDNLDLDWRIFVLLRLLQASKESTLKTNVMKNMKILLGGNKSNFEECQKVGKKLKNILSSPANAENPPEILLELYLWTLASFSENQEEACIGITKIMRNNANGKDSILICALQHLFYMATNLPKYKDFPRKIVKEALVDEFHLQNHESLIVQDLVHELLFVLELPDSILTDEISSFSNEHSIDHTMTYLDDFVLNSLQNGAPIYNPQKSLVSVQPEAKSPSLRFTPYNVMSESEWKTISAFSPRSDSNLSSGSFKTGAAVEVWTLKGRVKDPEKPANESSTTAVQSCDEPNEKVLDFQESVIKEVNEWK